MLKTVSSTTNAIGALNYKGTWNASTNTPTLASGVGTKGDYYVVSVAGTTSLDGIANWGVGDWATFNGSVWQRVEGGADLNGVNLTVTTQADIGNTRITSGAITTSTGALTVNGNSGVVDSSSKIRTTSVLAVLSGREWQFKVSGGVYQLVDGSAGANRAECGLTGLWRFNAYGAGTATFDANGNISSVSDERLKIKDGAPADPIRMVMALEPGYYTWKYPEQMGEQRELGHYAQNVHSAIGEEAAPTPQEDKPWGYYDRSVVAVHTLALQNHERRIKELESLVADMSARLTALESTN